MDTYREWEKLVEIEPGKLAIVDGQNKYIMYKKHCSNNLDSVYIRSLFAMDEHSILAPSKVAFSENGSYIAALYENDSLSFINPLTKYTSKYMSVKDFSFQKIGDVEFLVTFDNSLGNLGIYNCGNNEKLFFTKTLRYHFFKEEQKLAFLEDKTLKIYSFRSRKTVAVIENVNPIWIRFDDASGRMGGVISSASRSFFLYDLSTNKLELIENLQSVGDDKLSNQISNVFFSPLVDGLVFGIEDTTLIDYGEYNDYYLWSYKGATVNNKIQKEKVRYYMLDFKTQEANPVPLSNNRVLNMRHLKPSSKSLTMVNNVNLDEYYWSADSLRLTSFNPKKFETKIIHTFPKEIYSPIYSVSPSGRYTVWFDSKSKLYYYSDLLLPGARSLISKLKVPFDDQSNDIIIRRTPYGIAGWRNQKDVIWLYDKYDIWEVNLNNGESSCITKEIGKQNNIIFRVAIHGDITGDSVVISGFCENTKRNGLFLFSRGAGFEYKPHAMGDFAYLNNESYNSHGVKVLKYPPVYCQKIKKYIVYRTSSNRSGNLLLTSDFVNYEPLTQIHPEEKFLCTSGELIHWLWPNGHQALGLVYKPVNFDARKRYPVIFHFYEKKSDELNLFQDPSLSDGGISIQLFANQGYIVFCPDIYYSEGMNSQSIKKSIEGAVLELMKYEWVDTSRLGIQGHSFGGYETLVAISSLNYFKAAQESAGPSNLISLYSSIVGENTRQAFTEFNQLNMGCILWDCIDKYLNNSPLFNAPKINTPLLIMHNKGDAAVDFNQAVEIFGALRRLKKRSWLLSYKNEQHNLENEKNMRDFTNKQLEFFDYYLKGGSRPCWLVE